MNLLHCGLHCWFCASALCEIKTPSDFICLAVPSVHTYRVQGVYVQGDWYKCYIYCVRMVVLGKWPYLLIFSKVYNYFSFEIDLVMSLCVLLEQWNSPKKSLQHATTFFMSTWWVDWKNIQKKVFMVAFFKSTLSLDMPDKYENIFGI